MYSINCLLLYKYKILFILKKNYIKFFKNFINKNLIYKFKILLLNNILYY